MTKRHSRSRRSKETPGWMWMLLGLTMGLVFAGYIYLSDVRAPSSVALQARTSEKTPETNAEANKPEPRQSSAAARTPAAAQTATARSSSAPSSTAQTSNAPAATTQTSTRQASTPQSSTAQTQAAPTAAADPQPATQTAAARFQFYENLPQSEVVVPEPAAAASAGTTAAPATAAQTAAQTAARAPAPPPIQAPGSYILQVGSFRTHADADRRKANIALLGYESQIQQAIVNGELVHRVLVGPITDMATLDVARRRLRDQNFDTLVLTAK